MIQETKLRISKTLKFAQIFNEKGICVGGGIDNSVEHVSSEVRVELMDDPYLLAETDEEANTGRIQLHLGGSRRAFEELGVFLLALARFHPLGYDYSLSFELKDNKDKPAIHLVIHQPVDDVTEKQNFAQIHNVATAWISEDGTQVEDTTYRSRK